MKYTKYFSGVINQYGRPNLTDDQFRKFMNIVHLEGRIEGINSIKRTLKGTKEEYRFDMEYFRISKKLTELTGKSISTGIEEETIYISLGTLLYLSWPSPLHYIRGA